MSTWDSVSVSLTVLEQSNTTVLTAGQADMTTREIRCPNTLPSDSCSKAHHGMAACEDVRLYQTSLELDRDFGGG